MIHGGDGLLLLALLLGLFLPLSGRWAVDPLSRGEHHGTVTNLASATILSQLVIIYTANAFFKLGSDL